jgi:hypothetical protein
MENTGNPGYLPGEFPRTVPTYRCAGSEPRRQNFWFFMPYSGVTGQVGQTQPRSSVMQTKLLPVAQKTSSLLFRAQPV